MTPELVPIVYRGFYDVPRAFLVEYGEAVLYFLCEFSPALDDYEPEYRVVRLEKPLLHWAERRSWLGMEDEGTFLRRVPVGSVEFDGSRRRFVAWRTLEQPPHGEATF
jgi:hypothetical protein